MLESRLGQEIAVQAEDRSDTEISDGVGRRLLIADGLFGIRPEEWLSPESIPGTAPVPVRLPQWLPTPAAAQSVVPFLPLTAVDRDDRISLSTDEHEIACHADMLGSAFYFLSRYEEVAAPKFDALERFPARCAYSVVHGFHDRPVVDEYVSILAACLHRLWPSLVVLKTQFKVAVSHDVDAPLKYGYSSAARMMAGGLRDFFGNRSVADLRSRVASWHRVRAGDRDADPYNTFDRLIQEASRRDLEAAYYFIAKRPAGNRDALYDIDDPWITSLLKRISTAGHEIGLHASFDSYLDRQQTRTELHSLVGACERAGIRQARWGGRQHYLRWRTPDTYRNLSYAGLSYDTTMTFAENAGFRCGTCHEFNPYDLLERREIAIVERPLVAMDTSVIGYMGKGIGREALDQFLLLKNRCRAAAGVFSLLWHNSNLTTPEHWDLFLSALDG